MTFWYTARGSYDIHFNEDGSSWKWYTDFCKLPHLKELVSLDCGLNPPLENPDLNDPDEYDFIVTEDKRILTFYTTIEYVLSHISTEKRYNLLTVVKEPESDCRDIQVDGFEFMGYDLIDCYYSSSALSNSIDYFADIFLPSELNEVGLISDYNKAFNIRDKLHQNHPAEDSADCYVFAVWRHNTIGRI